MPTLCELKVEAKKRGLKGFSTMNKSDLEKLLAGGKPSAKKRVMKKSEPQEKLADEWRNLEKEGAGNIYDVFIEREMERLIETKKPKTEKQQNRVIEQAEKVAVRLMTKIFKQAKKKAKTNAEIIKNMRDIFNKDYAGGFEEDF